MPPLLIHSIKYQNLTNLIAVLYHSSTNKLQILLIRSLYQRHEVTKGVGSSRRYKIIVLEHFVDVFSKASVLVRPPSLSLRHDDANCSPCKGHIVPLQDYPRPLI